MKSLSICLIFLTTAIAVITSQELDWWEHGTFYEIYPRSFRDSDGDGVGDIRGIINSLDYLVDLGVDGFWLGPVFRSPMYDGGYDVQDYRQVDPLFGTMADLQELFTRAHELGLKVILDFVASHTSDLHEWFLMSQSRTSGFEDFYLWRDCPMEANGVRRLPNNWIAVYHTRAWTYNAIRGQCFLHHFSSRQPELNFRNQFVYAGMMANALFWLEQGVDGFRIDAVRMFETDNLPNEQYFNISLDRNSRDNLMHQNTVNRPETVEFLTELRRLTNLFSGVDGKTKIIMADTYQNLRDVNFQTQTNFYGSDERRAAHIPINYGVFFDALNTTSDALDYFNTFSDLMDIIPAWADPNWLLGNHDTSRIGSRFGDRHESLAMLSMLLPGPYIIYYGEELGMTDHRGIPFDWSDDPMARMVNQTAFEILSRDPVRTPFQWDNTASAGFSNTTGRTWLPVHPNFGTVNLRAQMAADRSTFKLYKRLIELRNSYRALEIGAYNFKVAGDYMFGFIRTAKGHPTVAVIINLSATPTAIILNNFLDDEYSDGVSGRVLATTTGSTVVMGSTIGGDSSITVGRFEALVFEINGAPKIVASLIVVLCSLVRFAL